jgi:hypothetical protein
MPEHQKNMSTDTKSHPILKPFVAAQSEQVPEKPQLFQAVDNLIEGNWQFIKEAAGDVETYTFSIKCEIDRRTPKSHLKLALSFSKLYKDSAEFWVEDPAQTELPLDKEPAKEKKPRKKKAKPEAEFTESETEPIEPLAICEVSSLPREPLAICETSSAEIIDAEIIDAEIVEDEA